VVLLEFLVVVLLDPFLEMKALRNFAEAQQSSHAPKIWTGDQSGRSNAAPTFHRIIMVLQSLPLP